MSTLKLLINSNGNIYFTENEPLVQEMSIRYPHMIFKATLSLGEFVEHNQLHKTSFEHPLIPQINAYQIMQSPQAQERVIDTLYDYLDLISERMHQNGIDAARVHLLSLEPQDVVNPVSMVRTMTIRFRAVFINGTGDES